MRSNFLRKFLGLYTVYFICHQTVVIAKIFDRCELAQLLKNRYRLSLEEVENWVCIAQYQSGLDSSLYTGTADNGAHGLFQISDVFWCTKSGQGYDRGINCEKLRDDDLTDDLDCVKKIYDEHQRLFGDGYNAWNSYPRFCKGKAEKLIQGCFDGSLSTALDQFDSTINLIASSSDNRKPKVYDRCELAQELRHRHNIPLDQIATWVCIAKYESHYNTSALGKLNADGSGDHGLFQISDIYWCSPPGKGWACGLSCNKLEDSDITDDVKCMKQIYEEHQRLSGDGFNAWAVYQPYCRGRSDSYIQGCFTDLDDNSIVPTRFVESDFFKSKNPIFGVPIPRNVGKIYSPCELAVELRDKHKIPREQIATWVCIAKYESNFNTSAIGGLNTDGSGDHGLFQISDIYWCSPPGNGWVCGLSCDRLEDSDITDDVECMKKIYEEHQRLSGDGFNAWSVYRPYCQGRAESHIDGCFNDIEENFIFEPAQTPYHGFAPISNKITVDRGKVYNSCELAHELRDKHNIPASQIATWVCIAKHESDYNTSAVGRLYEGGSADHGLFQISDIYWCSPPGKGWACGLSCNQLEDSDITDDVECLKKIYEEHQRLSGDGFNAWAVYSPYCKGRSDSFIKDCFIDDIDDNAIISTNHIIEAKSIRKVRSKVYTRCELAQELLNKHKMPSEQIATWVCIAEHESRLNTSAYNPGSGDHGLFQISNIYWCSSTGIGKACGTSCSKFEDDDISDDVRCIRKIYDEHTRLSGDGFNAWVVYPLYCKGKADQYIKDCKQGPIEKPTPTIRPPIIVPAITAPNDVFSYSQQFTKSFPTVTKTPTFAFKFSGTTQRATSPTPTSFNFDGKFFSTIPNRPGVQQPTISTTFKSSPISSTFGPTAASRFNLTPTPTTSHNRLSSTLKPLSSTTKHQLQPTPTASDIFDLYIRPRPSVTPTAKFAPSTVKVTSRPNHFTGFSTFDSLNRFSTTLKPIQRIEHSTRVSTTRKTSNFSFDFTTPKSKTIQSNRGSNRFVSTTKPFGRFTTLHRTRSTPFSPKPISSQATPTPVQSKNIFDIYFDLYNLQRSAISSTTQSSVKSSTTLPYQQTTKQPFWNQNPKISTRKLPSVFPRSSTPKYRESASNINLSIVTTRKPFKFDHSTIFTTKKPFKFHETTSHRPKASARSLLDDLKLPWSHQQHSPTISETTSVRRGFRFGSAFTNNPEKLKIITTNRPFKLEDSTTAYSKPFNQTFNNSQPAETRIHYRYEFPRRNYFDNVKISTTKQPFLSHQRSSTNSPATSQFRGFRFGSAYTSHPENLATTTTKQPFKFEESRIFTTKKPFKFEDSTISIANKPVRIFSESRTESSTKSLFDEFFNRFVH